MQQTRSSKITLIVIASVVWGAILTHIVARLLWHFQAFGWNHTDPTDFWQYTRDPYFVKETHLMAFWAIVAVAMIICFIACLAAALQKQPRDE